MVNIENLPIVISLNGDLYALNLHVTAWNKLCVGYQYVGSVKRALELKKEYNIFSSVVEPDMGDKPIVYSKDVTHITDVPNIKMGWNVLAARINTALADETIKVEH